MKNILLLFLFLVPAFLFAQYPTGTNKSRLGYQTTGDGLIWRGVAADTVLKPRVIAHAYFQLDTVNAVLRRYIATKGSWQVVGGGSSTDSTVYATKYWTSSNFFPLEGGTLTGTGGAGFIGFPSQVSAPGTPASGLNVYAQGSSFNWKGTDGYERQFASTLTGGRTYTLPDISGTFALGTGTADRLARWTATNTLAAGNLSDNGTRLAALLPWQFQSYTTAGLPTGVTGYYVYNTTTNGPAWYQGSRWAYGLESTFNRGTAGRIPSFDANGQITDNSGLTFQNPGTLVGTAYSSLRVTTSATATANNQFLTGTIFTTTNTPGAFTGIRNHVAAFLTDDATGSTIAIGRPYSNNFFATITSDFSTRNFIFDSGNSGGNLIFRKAGSQVLSVGSPRLAYTGSFFSSATESLYGLNTSFASEIGTSSYFLLREGNITGYKAAFGHDGNGSAAIYAQRANTNFVSTDMKFRLSGINGYAEFLNNTAGVLLGGGTTAQTPTEVNGLIRYNSDSTLYQIYQGGTRAYLATRAYARSLVSGLVSSNIYTSNGTLAGDRTLAGGGFSLTLAAKTQISDTLLLPLGKVKTRTYAPIIGKNVNWAENGSVMYGENLRKDSTGYGAGANVLVGLNLMQKARTNAGRFILLGDNILNGVTSAFNVVGMGIQVADQSTTAGSDFFVGGSVVARYATSLDRSVILASRSFNRVAGVNLAQTVAFGYGAGSTSTERSAGGTHYGYLQLQSLVYGDQISTYGYLAGRTIKRGTNLSFIGNYTGATDTMFSDASAIGNYAAIGQSQSITLGAINGVNSATYDAKIGIGTTTPAEKLHVVGAVRIEGMVTAIQEKYFTITSTSSPQTFSSTISDNIIDQGGTQASFTFYFPPSPVDGQVLTMTWNNAISTLTLNGNGNTIVGTAVTTAVAGTQRKFKYCGTCTTPAWIKIY